MVLVYTTVCVTLWIYMAPLPQEGCWTNAAVGEEKFLLYHSRFLTSLIIKLT